MKKTILAVAIASVSASSVAVELYNNDGTTFSIGGHVSVNVNDSEKGDLDVGSNSPRININATQELGNGFTADARGEWAINYLNGADNAFTTRLGYIGLTHDDLGRAVVGTQWAPYYDVANAADMPIAFANDFIYDNHGALGTGRADKMVSYRNGVDFGAAGELGFGLGWQGTNDATSTELAGWDDTKSEFVYNDTGYKYDDRIQVALTYAIAGAQLGYAYNTGDFTAAGSSTKQTAESHIVSAKYGTYGQGIYVAGVFASNENMNNNGTTLLEESTAYEGLVSYGFDNNLNLIANYEKVDGKETKNADRVVAREEIAIQAEYSFTPKFITYTAYQFDLNSKNNRETDDKWVIGARYYL